MRQEEERRFELKHGRELVKGHAFGYGKKLPEPMRIFTAAGTNPRGRTRLRLRLLGQICGETTTTKR